MLGFGCVAQFPVAVFIETSTPVSLFGRIGSAFFGKIQPNVAQPISGLANIAFKIRIAPTPTVGLAGRGAVSATGRAQPGGALPLSGKTAVSVFGRTGAAGVVAISARTAIAVAAGESLTLPSALSSKVLIAFSALAGTTGTVSLQGAAAVMTFASVFPSGAIALAGRSILALVARVLPRGAVPIQGARSIQAKALPGLRGVTSLLGRTAVQVRGQIRNAFAVSLRSRTAIQIKGKFSITNFNLTLGGFSAIKFTARPRSFAGLPLAGRTRIAVKAAAAPAGSLVMSGRASIAAAARGLLDGAGQLQAMVARTTLAFFGQTAVVLRGFVYSPRVVIRLPESRVAVVPESIRVVYATDPAVRTIAVPGNERTVIAPMRGARIVVAGYPPMPLQWPSKSPTDFLDYDIDFSLVLAAREPDFEDDTIATSTWTLVQGDVVLSQEAISETGKVTKVWIAAGTENVLQEVRNDIVSVGGRVFEQSVFLKIDQN